MRQKTEGVTRIDRDDTAARGPFSGSQYSLLYVGVTTNNTVIFNCACDYEHLRSCDGRLVR